MTLTLGSKCPVFVYLFVCLIFPSLPHEEVWKDYKLYTHLLKNRANLDKKIYVCTSLSETYLALGSTCFICLKKKKKAKNPLEVPSIL